MGIMVYSLLWVMQDLYHQPYVVHCLWLPMNLLRKERPHAMDYKIKLLEWCLLYLQFLVRYQLVPTPSAMRSTFVLPSVQGSRYTADLLWTFRQHPGNVKAALQNQPEYNQQTRKKTNPRIRKSSPTT